MSSLNSLQVYWSGSFIAANALIVVNLLGALLLGMLMNYERSYNGRASGMRTYGLVCMTSTALTVFVGDGSKFKAVNSRERNFSPGKIDERKQQVEQSIQRYLDALETADRTQPTDLEAKTERLQE